MVSAYLLDLPSVYIFRTVINFNRLHPRLLTLLRLSISLLTSRVLRGLVLPPRLAVAYMQTTYLVRQRRLPP